METNYQMTRSQLDILTEINKTHLNKNEIVYVVDEKKFYFWTGEEWSEYKANGGLNLNLYEFNKTLISQLPVLEDFTEAVEIIMNILCYYVKIFRIILFFIKQKEFFVILKLLVKQL